MGKRKSKTNSYKSRKRRTVNRKTASERLEWIEARWSTNPDIPINGRNGMHELLMNEFGVTQRDEQLVRIRERIMGKLDRKKPLVTRDEKELIEGVLRKYEQAEKIKSAQVAAADAPPLRKEVARNEPPSPPPPPTPKVPPAPHSVSEDRKPYHEPPRLKIIDKDGDVSYRRAMDVIPAPGTTRSSADIRIRFDWCREYMKLNPDAQYKEVIEACRRAFGIGISPNALGDIRRMLGSGLTRRRSHESHRHRRAPVGRIILDDDEVELELEEPETKPSAAPRRARRNTEVSASAIRAAVTMLLDELPRLRSLIVAIDENGDPDISFEMESIVSGTVTL